MRCCVELQVRRRLHPSWLTAVRRRITAKLDNGDPALDSCQEEQRRTGVRVDLRSRSRFAERPRKNGLTDRWSLLQSVESSLFS